MWKRWQNGKQQLEQTKGMAMIIVLCLLAVFMMLSLSTLLAASVLSGNMQKSTTEERVRILTVTLADELDQDLIADYSDQIPETGLWRFVSDQLKNNWSYFDEDDLEHSANRAKKRLTYTNEDGQGLDSCELVLYWTLASAADQTVNNWQDADLHVEMTGWLQGQSYRITTHYNLVNDKESLEDDPVFRWSRTSRE